VIESDDPSAGDPITVKADGDNSAWNPATDVV